MTDETQAPDDQLERERARGIEAGRVLESPVVIESFQAMDDALTQAFKTCPLRDQEGMLGIRYQMEALEKFKKNFATLLQTGKMAEMQIKALNERET